MPACRTEGGGGVVAKGFLVIERTRRRSARENRRKRRGRFTDGKSWVREVRKVVVDSCSPAERGVLCNGLCRATEGTKIVNVTARAKGNQG